MATPSKDEDGCSPTAPGEKLCPRCKHFSRQHSREGCGHAKLKPGTTGANMSDMVWCSCKAKYMDIQ